MEKNKIYSRECDTNLSIMTVSSCKLPITLSFCILSASPTSLFINHCGTLPLFKLETSISPHRHIAICLFRCKRRRSRLISNELSSKQIHVVCVFLWDNSSKHKITRHSSWATRCSGFFAHFTDKLLSLNIFR